MNFLNGVVTSQLNTIARKFLPANLRLLLKRWLRGQQYTQDSIQISGGYEILGNEGSIKHLQGWQNQTVATRQHRAFEPLLQQMYAGKPREDFVALASSLTKTGLEDPLILEVGCGSGWNSEVLTHLLRRQVHYIGLDYSPAMTRLGNQSYPESQFIVGDATALPLKDAACDVLISGTVLMHLLGYHQAIHESRRVARHWCIFHTVPVLQQRQTTILRKRAYGEPTVELIFNEEELRSLLVQNKLIIRHVLESISYNLEALLGEPTLTKTYVCEIQKG